MKTVELAESAANGDGWVQATDAGLTVALDTVLTPELKGEGNARELVRGIQNLRRRSGLAVTDRIHLRVEMSDDLWTAIEPFIDWVASETLALSIERGALDPADGTSQVNIDGERVTITLRRA